jgi:hypothetical protein
MERDLSNRIGERLRQWNLDSQELFQMGDLKLHRARQAIISHLLHATTICIAKWLNPKTDPELCKAFKRLLQEAREEVEKWNNDTETSI